MSVKKMPPVAAGGWAKSDNGLSSDSMDSLYQKSVRFTTLHLQISNYRYPWICDEGMASLLDLGVIYWARKTTEAA